jgi:hypothetical protein
MKHETRLGKLISGDEKRDAEHVAIAPVTAGETLKPGTPVTIDEDGSAHAITGNETPTGVVDPFLSTYLNEGDQFWLVMYPGTITGIRHDWSHPDLPDDDYYYDDGCRGC